MSNHEEGQLAHQLTVNVIKRCRENLRRLTTVQFDPETGIRRHYFNGKLERSERVRGIGPILPGTAIPPKIPPTL